MFGAVSAFGMVSDFIRIEVPIAYGWLTTGENYRQVTSGALMLMLVGGFLYLVQAAIREYRHERACRLWDEKVRLERESRPVPIIKNTIVSPYFRKEDAVHGDARAADDFEADQGLRDHSGGMTPFFKD
jgi:hypothetical protein